MLWGFGVLVWVLVLVLNLDGIEIEFEKNFINTYIQRDRYIYVHTYPPLSHHHHHHHRRHRHTTVHVCRRW